MRWTTLWVLAALTALGSGELSQAQVRMPGEPTPIPPPDLPAGTQDRDIERKRRQRRKLSPKKKRVLSHSEIQQKKLVAEAADPRPFRFGLSAGLALPWVMASGDRSNYTSEPSTSVHALFRVGGNPGDRNGLLVGMRVAAFSGTGTQGETPGRYGHTYIGPVVGWVAFDPEPTPLSSKAATSAKREGKATSTGGWMVLGGLAALSREGAVDHPNPESPMDFSSKEPVSFPPGFWLEASFVRLHYGAIGIHYSIGMQGSPGLIFPYLGIAVSGWN